jgi:methionyl-tRNA formyltransferase
LFSHSAGGFAALQEVCETSGHQPVAYVHARSLRPRRRSGPNAPATAGDIVEALPAGMDLLLPGSGDSLARALPGYRPDLLICHGFPWRLPRSVLTIPRLGGINVHPSLLPKYRGPVPIHWAIRNGDPDVGVTVHWMDESFDTGRVIVQRGGVPLGDEVAPERLLRQVDELSMELLTVALERVLAGFPGEAQNEAEAGYAGWMEDEFGYVDWARTAREVHNQVRTFRFGVPGGPAGPLAEVDGRWVAVLRTRLEPGDGMRVECADGPLWIVEWEAAQAPRC